MRSVPSSTLHAQVPTASGLTALAYCSRCASFVGLGLVLYANRSFPPGIGTAKALSVMATIT